MRETTGDALYHWRKRYCGLWTHIWVKNILMLALFQLLSSPDVNWWTGVVWITCDVLDSCLDSHSDGTHSLQSIHCWDTDAVTHFSKKQTHLHLGWPESEHIFIFCWTVPLRDAFLFIISIELPENKHLMIPCLLYSGNINCTLMFKLVGYHWNEITHNGSGLFIQERHWSSGLNFVGVSKCINNWRWWRRVWASEWMPDEVIASPAPVMPWRFMQLFVWHT